MSMPGRMKTMAGGNIDPEATFTIASAATLRIPDWTNLFYVSGTTAVTSISIPSHLRNRKITLIGIGDAEVSFANTNSPTTAGQMYLHGQNRIIREDDVIELYCKNDGTLILLNLIN